MSEVFVSALAETNAITSASSLLVRYPSVETNIRNRIRKLSVFHVARFPCPRTTIRFWEPQKPRDAVRNFKGQGSRVGFQVETLTVGCRAKAVWGSFSWLTELPIWTSVPESTPSDRSRATRNRENRLRSISPRPSRSCKARVLLRRTRSRGILGPRGRIGRKGSRRSSRSEFGAAHNKSHVSCGHPCVVCRGAGHVQLPRGGADNTPPPPAPAPSPLLF